MLPLPGKEFLTGTGRYRAGGTRTPSPRLAFPGDPGQEDEEQCELFLLQLRVGWRAGRH